MSLDQLVDAGEHRRRDREPQGLGGLHVDDELKLRWRLDGKIESIPVCDACCIWRS